MHLARVIFSINCFIHLSASLFHPHTKQYFVEWGSVMPVLHAAHVLFLVQLLHFCIFQDLPALLKPKIWATHFISDLHWHTLCVSISSTAGQILANAGVWCELSAWRMVFLTTTLGCTDTSEAVILKLKTLQLKDFKAFQHNYLICNSCHCYKTNDKNVYISQKKGTKKRSLCIFCVFVLK